VLDSIVIQVAVAFVIAFASLLNEIHIR
jgi:hypothetical protein